MFIKRKWLVNDCACGCGSEITPRDPSPDFKYIQCQLLWLASVDQDDPPWWRARQRYLYRLIALVPRWPECYWEYEITEGHVILYDDNQASYEDGLASLIQRWVRHFRTAAPELDIDVVMSQA